MVKLVFECGLVIRFSTIIKATSIWLVYGSRRLEKQRREMTLGSVVVCHCAGKESNYKGINRKLFS